MNLVFINKIFATFMRMAKVFKSMVYWQCDLYKKILMRTQDFSIVFVRIGIQNLAQGLVYQHF